MGLDYDKFLSRIGLKTEGMVLRNVHTILQNGPDNLISLANGNPNPETFPIESISLKLRNGTNIELNADDLAVAQQYGATPGSKGYQTLLRDLVKKLHNPPCWDKNPADGRTVVNPTAGATDGLSQCFRLFVDPGDSVLVEDPTYAGPVTIAKSMGLKLIPIQVDGDGILPESLRSVLSQWNPSAGDRPRVLYTVPTGQNPTGCTITMDRKREIYKIAQEYNLLIVEDDPYHFISFSGRVPSFLALDTDGRVVRVDSFSKVISPGMRAGYISGPEPLITKVTQSLGVSSHGTAPFIQGIILALFNHWGIEGFIENTKRTAEYYKNRRDVLVKCANKWLKGLVEYSIPNSGMFLWVKINDFEDSKDLMYVKALAKGVLGIPGMCFQPIEGNPSPYARLSFSITTPENMDEGLRRLSEALKEK